MGECRDIDPILGKTLGVLGHAELFEPVSNLLHRRPRFIVAVQVYRCTAELLDQRAKDYLTIRPRSTPPTRADCARAQRAAMCEWTAVEEWLAQQRAEATHLTPLATADR
jgi:hypothetical protein